MRRNKQIDQTLILKGAGEIWGRAEEKRWVRVRYTSVRACPQERESADVAQAIAYLLDYIFDPDIVEHLIITRVLCFIFR